MVSKRQLSVPSKKQHAAEAADALAADILAFLADDADRMGRFFDLTGLSPPILRQVATEAGFAAGLLDYLAADEQLVVAFTTATGRDPGQIETIRRLIRPSGVDDAF